MVIALRSVGSFRNVLDLDRRTFFSGLRGRHSGDVLLTGDSSRGGGVSAGGGEGSLGGGGGASCEVPLDNPLATLGGECGADDTVDGRFGALITAGGGSTTAGADSAAAGGSWGNSASRTSGRSPVGAVAGCSVTLGSGGGLSAGGGGAGAGAGFRGAGAAAPSVLRPRLGLTEMRGRLVDIATPERSASLAIGRKPSSRNAA